MQFLMIPFQMKRKLYGNILTSQCFSQHLTAYEISLLADNVIENAYDDQQTVYSVDSPVLFFYVVMEGRFVSINRAAQTFVRHQGDALGYEGIRGQYMQSTVINLTKGKLLCIYAPKLQSVIAHNLDEINADLP